LELEGKIDSCVLTHAKLLKGNVTKRVGIRMLRLSKKAIINGAPGDTPVAAPESSGRERGWRQLRKKPLEGKSHIRTRRPSAKTLKIG